MRVVRAREGEPQCEACASRATRGPRGDILHARGSLLYFAFDEFEFDGARLELRRNGRPLKVQRVALQLLAALLRQPGALVTKDTLVADVWRGRPVADNAITVAVNRLRRALAVPGTSRGYIATVYGVGYRFARPVVRSAGQSPASEPDVAAESPLRFVGRRAVLGELRHAAQEASIGRGRVCVVMGEAGVGKSSLVRVLTEELAGDTGMVAWGFCREAGSTPPLSPWLQVSRALLQSAPEQDPFPALRSVTMQLGELLRHAALPGDDREGAVPLDVSSPILWATARAILSAAEVTPLVLVFEDLHRADAASLEVLSLLVDEIGHARVLVLATLRESLGERSRRAVTALPYVLGHSNTARVAIKRLPEPEVLEYVAAALDDHDEKLGRAVYEKSQGNPFFMVELVRQLRRDDLRDPAQLGLPDAALDAVRQHVATLDADTRALLAAASVLGMSFDLSLLQAVTGRGAGELAALLDRAVASDVLVSDRAFPTAFAFAHELVRTALYDAMPDEERRRRHLHTAEALEQAAEAAHRPITPSELADHFYAALPYSDPEKTAHHCEAASRAAGAAYAYADAARHLRHALAALVLMPAPPPARHTSLLMRLAMYSRGSEPEVFLRCIREATQLARERNDVPTVLRASIMFHAHPELPALPGASEALEQALAMIPPEEAGRRACALAVLATAPPRAFSREQASSALREAEALLESTTAVVPLHRKVVLLASLFAEGGPGSEARFTAGVAKLDRIWARAPKSAPVLPLFLALNRAVRANQRGQSAAADAAVLTGLATAREIRHRELLWFFERFDALAKINAGACESGRLRLLALQRQAARRPTLGNGLYAAFDRAVVLPALGEPLVVDELERELRCQPWDTPGMWALKVRALAAAGLTSEARAALDRVAPAQLAELPLDSQYVGTLGLLARTVLLLKAHDYAMPLIRLLTPLEGYFASHASYFCEGSLAQLRGMLARMLGREREAHDSLQQGLRLCERAGFVPCAVEARIELALSVLALGGSGARRSARLLVGTARALAQQHHLPRLEARAAQLASELTGPSSASSAPATREGAAGR
ncbi:MAG: AAA family ATPase [Polyangiales bacterium]